MYVVLGVKLEAKFARLLGFFLVDVVKPWKASVLT